MKYVLQTKQLYLLLRSDGPQFPKWAHLQLAEETQKGDYFHLYHVVFKLSLFLVPTDFSLLRDGVSFCNQLFINALCWNKKPQAGMGKDKSLSKWQKDVRKLVGTKRTERLWTAVESNDGYSAPLSRADAESNRRYGVRMSLAAGVIWRICN